MKLRQVSPFYATNDYKRKVLAETPTPCCLILQTPNSSFQILKNN